MTEQALMQLLNDMTLEEKVMQLVQVPGSIYDQEAAVTGTDTRSVSPKVRQLAGSTLGIYDAAKARQIQKEYLEAHPHRIPLLMMADVIHGYTAFQKSSWGFDCSVKFNF